MSHGICDRGDGKNSEQSFFQSGKKSNDKAFQSKCCYS